ncbi:hypothetical protein ZWY2020_037659 [Hordeum vulgare]|nr:hypothetical protein ZWY2020_037659 [Hordeum vulgare]
MAATRDRAPLRCPRPPPRPRLTLRLRPAPRLRWTAAPLRQAGTPPLSALARCTSCSSSSPTRSTLAAPLLQEMAARYNRTNYSSYLNEEPMPDATSEKEQGNEYFKQKKFAEAIECYSRSVAMSPTAVAFANRAMAYLKLRRFEEAESDCTEALNLDDRYVKAYSRRITARKGLGKIKEAMDDAEFAVSVDANNPELRKQYSEIKALLMEKMAKRSSVQAKHTISEFDKAGDRKNTTSHAPSDPQKDSFMEVDSPGRAALGSENYQLQSRDAKQKPGPEISVQELASRAASRYMSSTVKSVKTPKTAYDFEVSWRAISDDLTQQIQLLKSIPPERLPEIFKDALSSAFLIDIVKDEVVLAVSILENLAKDSRCDLIIMCLSPMHKSELRKIWGQTFLAETASPDQVEILRQLQAKDSAQERLGVASPLLECAVVVVGHSQTSISLPVGDELRTEGALSSYVVAQPGRPPVDCSVSGQQLCLRPSAASPST